MCNSSDGAYKKRIIRKIYKPLVVNSEMMFNYLNFIDKKFLYIYNFISDKDDDKKMFSLD